MAANLRHIVTMAAVSIGIVLLFTEEKSTDDGVKLLPGKFSYCDAHKMCFQEGQKIGLLGLMIGENIESHTPRFKKNFPVWTRLHSLLSDVWINGDCGKSVNESIIKGDIWKHGIIGRFDHRVTAFDNEGLFAVPQNGSLFSCVCEFYEASVPSQNIGKFEFEPYVKNWPMKMENFMAKAGDENQGCFEDAHTETLVQCGFRCQQLLYCRAIYYHEESKQCKLVLFVDARIPYNASTPLTGWVRFARREWGKRSTV